MEAHDQYLSAIVVLDAALLLILTGLATKRLEWRRPAAQPLSCRLLRTVTGRHVPSRRLPRWLRLGLLVGALLGAGAAGGAGLAGLVAPAAALFYLAAAAFVLLAML